MRLDRLSVAWFGLGLISACVPLESFHYPGRVGGRVHGLWDGANGVALRLRADGVDTLLNVATSGSFRFDESLAPGTFYTVTVATNPVQHTCVVDGGDNGVVADADVTSVSVACTGPTVAIALSGPLGWTFDPLEETQTFAGSIVAQDVAFTISGSGVTSASVQGMPAAIGAPTTPIALPLGSTMVPVALTASGGLSKTYQLVFDRGSSVLDQVMYGKASNTGANDFFGASVSLSGDTLAVGARYESSATTGVNGNQADNSVSNAGAVYVFR
jgi:hypothetical protein